VAFEYAQLMTSQEQQTTLEIMFIEGAKKYCCSKEALTKLVILFSTQ